MSQAERYFQGQSCLWARRSMKLNLLLVPTCLSNVFVWRPFLRLKFKKTLYGKSRKENRQTDREPSDLNLSLVRGELSCCTRRAVCPLRFANRGFLRSKNRFVGLLPPFGYSLTNEGVAKSRLPDNSSAVFVVGRLSCRVPVL